MRKQGQRPEELVAPTKLLTGLTGGRSSLSQKGSFGQRDRWEQRKPEDCLNGPAVLASELHRVEDAESIYMLVLGNLICSQSSVLYFRMQWERAARMVRTVATNPWYLKIKVKI